MLRVLVAEDSRVSLEYLVHLLGQGPDLVVAGTAGDGLEAVRQAQSLKPNVILMDVHMPRMNGLDATREIMRTVPTPIVMMSAAADGGEANLTFEAISAGALTSTDKPRAGPDGAEGARRLIETLMLMAEVKVVRRWDASRRPRPLVAVPPVAAREVRILAMGASTGGPPVLLEILRGLPPDFGAPILVVQHITPGFVGALAEWLNQKAPFRVRPADGGEAVEAGRVYVAPDSVHMEIDPSGRIRLTQPLSDRGFCPSIDHLFASVAGAYGPYAIGVILTGMGRDGAVGLREIQEAGGSTIAQDEATSAVFGIPKEAIRLQAAQRVLPVGEIAPAIVAVAATGGGHRGAADTRG